MQASRALGLLCYSLIQWLEIHHLQETFPTTFDLLLMLPRLLAKQSNYSNIECELLGVVFSCMHFKHFAYGCKVTVITDHKPLVSLFKKSLGSSSPQLARMLLQILNFDLDVVYQPGSHAFIWCYQQIVITQPRQR